MCTAPLAQQQSPSNPYLTGPGSASATRENPQQKPLSPQRHHHRWKRLTHVTPILGHAGSPAPGRGRVTRVRTPPRITARCLIRGSAMQLKSEIKAGTISSISPMSRRSARESERTQWADATGVPGGTVPRRVQAVRGGGLGQLAGADQPLHECFSPIRRRCHGALGLGRRWGAAYSGPAESSLACPLESADQTGAAYLRRL